MNAMRWLALASLLVTVTVAEAGAPFESTDLSHVLSPLLTGTLIARAVVLGLLSAWRRRP
jgi:hypothetical protein